MEPEDSIGLLTSSDLGLCVESELHALGNECSNVDKQPSNCKSKEDINRESLGLGSEVQYEDSHGVPEEDLERNSVDMEIEDAIGLPASINSSFGIENCADADTQPRISVDKENKLSEENVNYNEGDDSHCSDEANLDKSLLENPSALHANFEVTETLLTQTLTVSEELISFSPKVHNEIGNLAIQDDKPIRSQTIDGSSISGVKRARVTIDEHQASVRIIYNSLARASKKKLEELLQQWSKWHAQQNLSQDPGEVLESGEETFFPALHVGQEKTFAVSFWMDNHARKQNNKEFIPLDSSSVPLYDRGYALGLTSADGSSNIEGGLEIIDKASRCFNCGSYSHSLRECPRPRDNVAVNSARKQHKSRRNQSAGSRNPTRYYQNPSGGKYDGLRAGALDAETRQLLGLGERDPPPWLNRMREMGYPPGYLDPDDEDQPSGITIYADGDITEEQEDGEIIETDYPKPKRKMTVEFPGMNAPIPENSDKRLWAPGTSSLDLSRNRLHRRLNTYPEHVKRGNHHEQRRSRDFRDEDPENVSRGHHHEQRRSRDFRDDGPPGDPGYSSLMSSFHPRYGSDDSSYSNTKGNISVPRSPILGRSQSSRGRSSPLGEEVSLNHGSYNSFSYSPPGRFLSPQDYSSSRFENPTENLKDKDLDHPSWTKDKHEGRHRWR
ncbi:Zinc finger CCHC domain-containing protein 8 [Quillaja saponaria]|uniref:Zinc finger CCHC domain-containing protein 8 n=1 Tax=Quillaja saponaria TaxID=32244 RepID=A0AAD7PXV9_QUISA|nr:Zinc finger CCHC domain-containing protein 8 [Quillaja saponaria]